MASIFSLFGEILIDNTNANKQIDTTTDKAEKSGSKVGSAFSSIAKGAAAVGTAVVSGAAAVGTSAFKMATDTAGAADEVDKMSQKLGMSRQSYQEWDYVMAQAGVDVNSLESGVKTLTNKLDDAKNGSAGATEAFSKLGLSTEQLQNMSREEVFDATIKALQQMPDSAERAALANDLLGKSGQNLTPLFNETAESTEALKQKAHDLGMVMSDDTVDAGVKFTDTIDTIKRSFQGMMNRLGGTVLPLVQKVLEFIESKIPTIQELFTRFAPLLGDVFETLLPPLFDMVDTLLPAIFDLIEALLPVLKTAIETILPVILQFVTSLTPVLTQIVTMVLPVIVNLIGALMPALTEIISAILPVLGDLIAKLLPPVIQIIETILPTVIDLINTVIPLVVEIISAILPVLMSLLDLLTPLLQPVFDLLEAVLSPLMDIIKVLLPPLIKLITQITQTVLPPLQKAFTAVANILSGMFSNAFEYIGKQMNNIKGIFEGVVEFVKGVFTGNWRQAWDGLKTIFTNVWNGIKEAFKAPINFIIDGINGLINGLNGLQIPDWVPVIGGQHLNIPTLPRLRVGIDYVPYDEFPALLHRGEQVLTAREAEQYHAAKSQEQPRPAPVVNITIGERAIWIERLDGRDEKDIGAFVDTLLEIMDEKIARKGAVFA